MFRLKTDTVARLAAVALMAGGCSDAGGPSTPGQLSFNLATHAAPAAAATAPAACQPRRRRSAMAATP